MPKSRQPLQFKTMTLPIPQSDNNPESKKQKFLNEIEEKNESKPEGPQLADSVHKG